MPGPDRAPSSRHAETCVASLIAAAALGCAVLVAACGGSHPESSKASFASLSIRYADSMRAHGVPNFPDPSPGGGFNIPTRINQFSPAFESASTACANLVPGGHGPPPPITEAQRRSALKFAECVRAHGISTFPGPGYGHGLTLDFEGMVFPVRSPEEPSATLSPEEIQSSAFKKAAADCGHTHA